MSASKIIEQHWAEIHSYIVEKAEFYLTTFENDGLNISAKMQSEFISQICESAFEIVLKKALVDVISPKKDSEPDCYVLGEAVELKTTKGEIWRGGEFSKRPGLYILLSWAKNHDNKISLFAAMQKMKESDWVSSMSNAAKNGKKAKYYGTFYGKSNLVEQNKYSILSGDVEVKTMNKNGTKKVTPLIKLIKE